MRYCRFLIDDRVHYGAVEDRGGEAWIVSLIDAPEEDLRSRLAAASSREITGGSFRPMPLGTARLLAPVTPTKIICVGRNYREHVKEMGGDVPTEPLIFFKPVSALLAPGGVVRMPRVSARVDYEGELAVVIGRRASKLKAEEWRSVVRGYTLANDVTARDLQRSDAQWTRAKGFDTFCPCGPWVSDEVDPEAGLTIETRVNGELRQHASTVDFIFPIGELLAYITAAITLEPGDMVLTGTPSGVAPLSAGDCVEVTISGLGVLSNTFQPQEA
jgi:2-keto-4-pentenoate hydratase/2-oxohepta-3-ene-1,7-dioic acid hydratase in catechol pathway